MKPWELLGETRTPEGSDVRLTRQDNEYVILVDGKSLPSGVRVSPSSSHGFIRRTPACQVREPDYSSRGCKRIAETIPANARRRC